MLSENDPGRQTCRDRPVIQTARHGRGDAATNPVAELAMQQIGNLMNSDAHSTTMMSSVDINMFHKLGINLTCEPVYETKKLYHR